MCGIKDSVDSNILWNIGRGNISFCFDNWSTIGPSYKKIDDGLAQHNVLINEVFNDGQWDCLVFMLKFQTILRGKCLKCMLFSIQMLMTFHTGYAQVQVISL